MSRVDEFFQHFFVSPLDSPNQGLVVRLPNGENYSIYIDMSNGDPELNAAHFKSPFVITSVDDFPSSDDVKYSFSDMLDIFGLRSEFLGIEDISVETFKINFLNYSDLEINDVRSRVSSLIKIPELETVRSSVDKNALSALRCASDFQRSSYLFYALPGQRGDYRRQAAAVYPLFAKELSSKITLKMSIDRQLPLNDVLIKAFGVDEFGTPLMSKSLLRRLSHADFPDQGIPLQVIISSLSSLPVEWFPKDEMEWNSYVKIANSFSRFFSLETGQNFADLVKGSSGKWTQYIDRLAKNYANTFPPDNLTAAQLELWKPDLDTSAEAVSDAQRGCMDVLYAFRNTVILPLAAFGANGEPAYVGKDALDYATRIAYRILYGGRTLPEIVSLQRHWHTQAHNFTAAIPMAWPQDVEGVENQWAAMCQSYDAPNGVKIIPLVSENQLRAEGADLEHCVGGYAPQCIRGDSHIVSFRDESGKRLSTAEFSSFSYGQTDIKCLQHKGRGNHTPPKSASDAHKWFLESIKSGGIPLNYDGLLGFGNRSTSRIEILTYSLYDYSKYENISQVYEPWVPYISKNHRTLDLEGMLSDPEISELTSILSPTTQYKPMG